MSDTNSVYTGTVLAGQSRVAGIATMVIDGENFDVVSDVKYNAVSLKREGLINQSGASNYSEMPAWQYIGAKIRDAGNMTVALFMAKTDTQVTLYLANGKTVSGDNLFCQECTEVETQEATFSVMFYGKTVTENPV